MARRSVRRRSRERHARRRRLRCGGGGDGVQVLWDRRRSAAVELVSNCDGRIHGARLALLGPRSVVRARSRAARVRGLAFVSIDRFEHRARKSRDRPRAFGAAASRILSSSQGKTVSIISCAIPARALRKGFIHYANSAATSRRCDFTSRSRMRIRSCRSATADRSICTALSVQSDLSVHLLARKRNAPDGFPSGARALPVSFGHSYSVEGKHFKQSCFRRVAR